MPVIRHKLITSARLESVYRQSDLIPARTKCFPLEFPGTFQGLRWLPGGEWLVLLFHSRKLNPARHSNLWLMKPHESPGKSKPLSPPVSASLQSEWCWKPISEQDGPYLSSRGDYLLLLHTDTHNRYVSLHYQSNRFSRIFSHRRTFGICYIDTKASSLAVTLTFHADVFVRNYVTAGDYIAYGWITSSTDVSEQRHFVRIMKLDHRYSNFAQDITVEVDCPPGHRGRLQGSEFTQFTNEGAKFHS